MPTGLPTEVTQNFDSAQTIINGIGLASLVILLSIAAWKWSRGAG